MYFQSVIMNSSFADVIQNTNRRYIDWSNKIDASPAELKEDSYHEIIESDVLFARKFGSNSTILKDMIIDYCKLERN